MGYSDKNEQKTVNTASMQSSGDTLDQFFINVIGINIVRPDNPAALFPVSAAIHAEERRIAEEKENNPEPGDKMKDGTIYLGKYTPINREGVNLGKTFNVFAAPQDLPERMTYVDTVAYIAALKNWNGYDGTDYATDKEIYAAINADSYAGGWIIPTRDILRGKNVNAVNTTPDNLYAHQSKGAFQGTFKTAVSSHGSSRLGFYWSSTELRNSPFYVCGVGLSDGYQDGALKHRDLFNCRPVRLVQITP